jgi:CTP-dependent riboflavin kinase
MKVVGTVFSGVGRGVQLINLNRDRIYGLLGIKAYRGTLNLRLEKPLYLKRLAHKFLYRVIKTGHMIVEMRFYKARIKDVDCWVMRQEKSIFKLDPPYKDDVLEIIAKENLRERFELEDGDEVEVEILEEGMEKRPKKKYLGKRQVGTYP